MDGKNYYQILGVSQHATYEQIRKAFRKLVFAHHPDTVTINTPHNGLNFNEIQEAYFVLSDADRRSEYHTKQGLAFFDAKKAVMPVTAASILTKCKNLNAKIAELDVFRMNKELLYNEINTILTASNIELLQTTASDKELQQITGALLQSCKVLNYEHVAILNATLAKLAGANNELIATIYANTKVSKQHNVWQKYNGLLIVVLTIMLCFLIWFLNK
jgi:hypothetical protein